MTEFTENSTTLRGLDGGYLSSGMGGASDIFEYSRLTAGPHSLFLRAGQPAGISATWRSARVSLECGTHARGRASVQPMTDGEPSPPFARRSPQAPRATRRTRAGCTRSRSSAAWPARSCCACPRRWWAPAVGFVALAGLVFRLANWKSQACGERLPTRGGRGCRGCSATMGRVKRGGEMTRRWLASGMLLALRGELGRLGRRSRAGGARGAGQAHRAHGRGRSRGARRGDDRRPQLDALERERRDEGGVPGGDPLRASTATSR